MISHPRHIVTAGVLLALVAACAPQQGGQVETSAASQSSDKGVPAGIAAYEAGSYAAAFQILRPLADQGNAEAQVNLGYMYARGQGVA